MGHFESLIVWQKARALSNDVENLVSDASVRIGKNLGNQTTSAADSIVHNIAESSGRDGLRDQIRILNIALGSAQELESQLCLIADRRPNAASRAEQMKTAVKSIQQMINGLINHKRRRLDDD